MYGKVVVIRRDGEDGAMFPIQQKTVTMGRTGDCDIRIQRPSVSRFQCSLDVNDNKQLMLRNLSETNPTSINGRAVKEVTPIYHQDIIQIDDRYFRIEYPPGSVFAMVPRSPASSAYSRQIVGRHEEEPEILSPQIPQNKIKTVKKRKSEYLPAKSPNSTSIAKKRISFAPGVSPEIFDKTLPASMPIKRGSVPASPVPTRTRKSLLRTPGAKKFSPLKENTMTGKRRSKSLSMSPLSASKNKTTTPVSEKIVATPKSVSEDTQQTGAVLIANQVQVGIENVSPEIGLVVEAKKDKPLTPIDNYASKQPLSSVANNMPLNAAVSPFPSRNILKARRSRASTVPADSPDSSLDSITDFLTPDPSRKSLNKGPSKSSSDLTPEPSKQSRPSLNKSPSKPVGVLDAKIKTPTPVKVISSEKPVPKTSNVVAAVSPATRKVILARNSVTPAPKNSLRVGLLKKTLPKTQASPKSTPQVQEKKAIQRKSIFVRKSTLMGKAIVSKNTPKAAPKTWADIAKKRLTPKVKKTGPTVVTKLVNGKMKSTVRVHKRVRSFGTATNGDKNYVFDYSSASGFASPTIIIGHQVKSKVISNQPLEAKSTTSKVTSGKRLSQGSPKKQQTSPIKPQAQAPKPIKKSVTPRLSGVKKLMKSPKEGKSPDVRGVRKLMKSPKETKSPNVSGVRKLMKSPKEAKSPNVSGVRKLMKSPREAKSPDVRGVRSLLQTPKELKSPKVGGLKRMLLSAEAKSKEVTSPKIGGLKRMLLSADPKPTKSPRLSGVAELLKSPEPKQSATGETKSPSGLKRLFTSPKTKGAKSPRLSGVAEMMKSPEIMKVISKTPEPKISAAKEIKNKLEEIPKTVPPKSTVSKSPRKTRGAQKTDKKAPVSPVKESAKTRTAKKLQSPKKAVPAKKSPVSPVLKTRKVTIESEVTPKQHKEAAKVVTQREKSPVSENTSQLSPVVTARASRTARKATSKNVPAPPEKNIAKPASPKKTMKTQEVPENPPVIESTAEVSPVAKTRARTTRKATVKNVIEATETQITAKAASPMKMTKTQVEEISIASEIEAKVSPVAKTRTRTTRKAADEKVPAVPKKQATEKATSPKKILITEEVREKSPAKVSPVAKTRTRMARNAIAVEPEVQVIEKTASPKKIVETQEVTEKSLGSESAKVSPVAKTRATRNATAKKDVDSTGIQVTEKAASPKKTQGVVSTQEVEAVSTPRKARNRAAAKTASTLDSTKPEALSTSASSPKKTRTTRNAKQQENKSIDLPKDTQTSIEKEVAQETNTSKTTRNTRRQVQDVAKVPVPAEESQPQTPRKTRDAKVTKVDEETSPKKNVEYEPVKKVRSTRGNKVVDVQPKETEVIAQKAIKKTAIKCTTVEEEIPLVKEVETIISPRKTRGKATEEPQEAVKNEAKSKDTNAPSKRTRAAAPVEKDIESSPKKPKIAAVEKTVKVSPKKTRSGKTKEDLTIKKTETKNYTSPKAPRSLRSRRM